MDEARRDQPQEDDRGDRDEALARMFTQVRPRLVGIAYAVVGTLAEAEDVVSDCWLRLAAADRQDRILDVEAWSTVAVARRALDVLRSARVQRQAYVGPWLPEPLLGDGGVSNDPADRVTLDESVSFALMVVLETLSPAERTAWVLHEVFALPFPEIAVVVGRSPSAVRQLAVRARAHVAAAAVRVKVVTAEHDRAVAAFLRAASEGDLPGLIAVLDPAVVLTSDGGGRTGVARRPVHGADRVARFLIGIRDKGGSALRVTPTTVNGGPGFIVRDGSVVTTVCALTVLEGRVHRVDLVLAPNKLPRSRLPAEPGRGSG